VLHKWYKNQLPYLLRAICLRLPDNGLHDSDSIDVSVGCLLVDEMAPFSQVAKCHNSSISHLFSEAEKHPDFQVTV